MLQSVRYVRTLRQVKHRFSPAAWPALRHPVCSPHASYATQAGKDRSGAIQTGRESTYPVFDRINFPDEQSRRDPDTWVALVENGLPGHLRSHPTGQILPDLSVAEVAQIVLTAQRPATVTFKGTDILFQLGIVHERWSAVVWLVKQFIDLATPKDAVSNSDAIAGVWKGRSALGELTQRPIELDASDAIAPSRTLSRPWAGLSDPDAATQQAVRLRREIMGSVWRSLGAMVVSCTEEGVKPEILEIIAYLHHHEIMPKSIYNQRPSIDGTSIQQPPMLNLLSSRILTSLTDAAWRAHEKLIVEDAKARGGTPLFSRPELPGSVYRVHVAGLRPEVWLELILWACLHGGWVLEGAAILRLLAQEPQPREWRPLSWRQLMPTQGKVAPDWDELDTIASTRSAWNMDPSDAVMPTVARTVSSEVVNAYVDGLVSMLDSAPGEKPVPLRFVLGQLNTFRKFLQRSKLTLGAGSWDAIIVRLLELQGDQTIVPGTLAHVESLSPRFGVDVETDNASTLPPYVLDGSAMMLGLYHRALQIQVDEGNLESSVRMLRRFQDYTDANKRHSLESFFRSTDSLSGRKPTDNSFLFNSNYKIDFPAFDLQIPPKTLAALLELVTDSKATQIGRWMLSNDELDGPLIPERLYDDPLLSHALVHFASVTGDDDLLAKVVNLRTEHLSARKDDNGLSRNVLGSFLDAQIELRRWPAAHKLLLYTKNMPGLTWSIGNLATVARMLVHLNAEKGMDSDEFTQAKRLFFSMIDGRYDGTEIAQPDNARKQGIDGVLLAAAVADTALAEICKSRMRPRRAQLFTLQPSSFFKILEAVIDVHGSAAGRRLLDTFWTPAIRKLRARQGVSEAAPAHSYRYNRSRPSVLNEASRQRSVVSLTGPEPLRVAFYGGLRANLLMITTILRRALTEFQDSSSAGMKRSSGDEDDQPVMNAVVSIDPRDDQSILPPLELLSWAIDAMQHLGLPDKEIYGELDAMISGQALPHLRAELEHLLPKTAQEEVDGIEWLGPAAYQSRGRQAANKTPG